MKFNLAGESGDEEFSCVQIVYCVVFLSRFIFSIPRTSNAVAVDRPPIHNYNPILKG